MIHTRDMRKNPGIKRSYLPLPEALEGTQSFCITIPDGLDNKLVLIDLLTIATYWFNWERSLGTLGKEAADAWRDTLNLPELNMCCCPEPTNRRYNENGELEVSYDGGITWSPAPELDDRFSGIIAPPIAGADGTEKACAAAASAEEFVKQNLIDALSDGDTYAQIYAAAIAIIAALGVTGIGILIAAAASAIFIAGVAVVQAAFTSEVWTDFRCILYCRISPDGSFTTAGWQGVKADILSTFTGVVSAVLYNWVNSVGVVGLTNAARSGFVASADCSGCDCPNECVSAERILIGTLVSQTDTEIVIQAVQTTHNGLLAYWIQYGSTTVGDYCCTITDWEASPGEDSSGHMNCDGSPQGGQPGIEPFNMLEAYREAGTWQLTLTFAG